ncbi:MAG: iron-only hydrogenase system regulator [Spirochaetales bacterium]|nr:iron-only hydrogenase system regulator [Spirochaetales bacterium]MCF7937533.1 iron-only hydrogenase system regulator [Spirochaetales bacterium]
MEKRIGSVIILVEDRSLVPTLNQIFTEHCDIIIGRQGVPLHQRKVSVISLIVEGTTDAIGALTGKIGRMNGVMVKSVLTSAKMPPKDTDHWTI